MLQVWRRRQRSAAILALTLVAASAQASPVDPKIEEAREHYRRGDAYYKLDRYQEAVAAFGDAYVAKPDPSFLFNIAQCHRLLRNNADALRFYRRFLREAPQSENRAVAEKHVRDLEALPADGGAPPPSPPAPSSQAVAAVEVVGTQAPVVTVPQATSPALVGPLDSAGSAPPPVYKRWWFWAAAGAVVVGIVLIGASANGEPSCPTGRICQ